MTRRGFLAKLAALAGAMLLPAAKAMGIDPGSKTVATWCLCRVDANGITVLENRELTQADLDRFDMELAPK